MGNIFFDPFETKNKVKLNELEQGYFNNINRILRDNYKKYEENDNNYLISFEKKSFSSSQSIGINPEDLDYITWYDYIYDYITRLYEKDNQISWVRNLLEFLDKDDFFNQHKYQSIFLISSFI